MELMSEDCFEHIMKFLSLSDQLNLQRGLKNMKEVIYNIWAHQFKKKLIINFYEFPLTVSEFDILLQYVRKTIEIVVLRGLHLKLYAVLCKNTAKNVVEFRFTQTIPATIEDEHLLQLKEVFPNLRSLSPHGKLNCTNLVQATPKLECLSVRYCDKITPENLVKLLSELPLKGLEVLSMLSPMLDEALPHFQELQIIRTDCDVLEWLLSHKSFARMHNLREFLLYETPKPHVMKTLNRHLYKFKADQLVEEHLHFDQNYPCMPMCMTGSLFDFRNIKRLSINNNSPEFRQLLNTLYHNKFGYLQEVYLYRVFFFCRLEIDKLLENTEYLSLLSLEYCKTTFRKIIVRADSIIPKRSSVLTLNLYENVCVIKPKFMNGSLSCPLSIPEGMQELIFPCTIDFMGSSPLLKVTRSKLYVPFEGIVKHIFKTVTQ